MSDPSPEKKSFFQKNIKELGFLIERTNVSRSSKRFPALTEEEIDKALDDLMDSDDPKAAIASYQFEDPKEKLPQVKSQVSGIQGDKFKFEVIKCSNGYLMTMNIEARAETFIFKTLEELSGIFSQVLFTTKHDLKIETKEGKASNGRVKKSA